MKTDLTWYMFRLIFAGCKSQTVDNSSCSSSFNIYVTCVPFQVAGSLVLDLNDDGVFAEPAEADDRRNVFQLNTAKQRR